MNSTAHNVLIPAVSTRLCKKADISRLAQVSIHTVDQWMAKGLIPYLKVGRSVRFQWIAVQSALLRHERQATKRDGDPSHKSQTAQDRFSDSNKVRDLMKSQSTPVQSTHGNLVSFYGYLESLNKTRTTGWRWRRDQLINTVNVFGRLYVTRDEIERFETRALAGEFYREHKAPSPRRVAASEAEGCKCINGPKWDGDQESAQ